MDAIVEVQTGKELARVEYGKLGFSAVLDVAYLPQKSHVLLAVAGGPLQLWSVTTGKPGKRFTRRKTAVSVAISGDGQRALSGHGKSYNVRGGVGLTVDRTVRLWDVKTGNILGSFKGHEGGVGDVAFSPDGKYAVSSGGRGTVRVWRLPD